MNRENALRELASVQERLVDLLAEVQADILLLSAYPSRVPAKGPGSPVAAQVAADIRAALESPSEDVVRAVGAADPSQTRLEL